LSDVENELVGESAENPHPKGWNVAVRSISGNASWIVQHTPDIDKAITLAKSCFEFGATRVEIEILPDRSPSVPATGTETE
jgi:hypothetical protein